MNNEVLSALRKELVFSSSEKIKEGAGHFFKETVRFYGVKVPVTEKIGSNFFRQIKSMEKGQIFELCEELFRSAYFEEGIIACNWSYNLKKEYRKEDFAVFERWVNKYVSNWAVCDTLCNHTIGSFIDKFPEFITKLKHWAKSENRWVRRASAVTLILPARHGRFLSDIFEISDLLLTDTDDLVRKGYGWMLKEASKSHPDEVFAYIMKNKKIMPRTALRYTIEKMPPDMKKEAMKK